MAVGSTALKPGQVVSLQPGESVKVTTQLAMHQGMGGPHDFRWTIVSNDTSQPEQVLTLKVEYPKP